MGGCPGFVALDFVTASALLCDIVVFCSLATGQRPDHPFPLSLCGWLCSHRCLTSPLGRTRSALGHGRCCSRLSWPACHLAQVLCVFLSSGWGFHSLWPGSTVSIHPYVTWLPFRGIRTFLSSYPCHIPSWMAMGRRASVFHTVGTC